MLIYGIFAFILVITMLIPYKELGEATNFTGYDTSVSGDIDSYTSNIGELDSMASQHLNETKQTKPLFTQLSESLDRMGGMVQSVFDTIGKTTDMIDKNKELISKGSEKAQIPPYIIIGVLAIITILVIFGLIKIIRGV